MKGLIPLFCRAGTKYRIRKTIINLFPKEYNTYVEPFVGGGSIFLNAPKNSKKEIINDNDREIIKGFRLIKRVPTNLEFYPKSVNTIPKLQRLFNKKYKSNQEQI